MAMENLARLKRKLERYGSVDEFDLVVMAKGILELAEQVAELRLQLSKGGKKKGKK